MTLSAADEVRYTQRGIPVSNGKLAMWLFLVTEIMFFTGLIGTYVVLRKSTPSGAWPEPPAVHLKEYMGAINTFVLIFSSFTVVLAHSSIMKGNGKKALIYIAVTFVMGVVFMGIKAIEYMHKFENGIMPGRMGDNLIDPALKRLSEPDESGTIPLDRPEYEHLRDPKYARFIAEAGKHPYDPNSARMYKE